MWADFVYYDETSPTCLRWKVEIRSGRNHNQVNVSPGDVAGCTTRKREHHFVVTLNGEQTLAHRIVYSLFHSLAEDDTVDHEDGDGFNNRIKNLRLTTQTVNMRNCKQRVDNKTGVTGVSSRINRQGCLQFTAQWCTLDGKLKTKTFSSARWGEQEAFRLACDFRASKIQELNSAGAGYTERHGT